jgi:NAD(P)-dependent dehydrogenase (short-subunit alcohol dehydrogenase family)
MEIDEWSRQLSVILDGTFLCTRRVARDLVAAGASGSIVNVISTAGHQGEPGNVAYCTGKAGLLNFTRSVAMELAGHRIRVNSLTPTATDPSDSFDRAERWGRARPPESLIELFEPYRRGVPMKRLPTPVDYGKAVVFLSSEDARFITGTDLRVDAGAVARYWAWDPETKQS